MDGLPVFPQQRPRTGGSSLTPGWLSWIRGHTRRPGRGPWWVAGVRLVVSPQGRQGLGLIHRRLGSSPRAWAPGHCTCPGWKGDGRECARRQPHGLPTLEMMSVVSARGNWNQLPSLGGEGEGLAPRRRPALGERPGLGVTPGALLQRGGPGAAGAEGESDAGRRQKRWPLRRLQAADGRGLLSGWERRRETLQNGARRHWRQGTE